MWKTHFAVFARKFNFVGLHGKLIYVKFFNFFGFCKKTRFYSFGEKTRLAILAKTCFVGFAENLICNFSGKSKFFCSGEKINFVVLAKKN